ncbi:MAG: malto-oligosyltrehalose synthase [Candidatus Protochlamydia sp.]|nr:malto-oligosyltrehalose synthase [Candidatus Protochlamydia sp.]
MKSTHIPNSTYRLQFNHLLTFEQAGELVPYFNKLGISDIYASPLTKSLPGSLHGYDVVDFNEINPEIGTENELGEFVERLHKHKMGLILDIVPNHMCVITFNKWWNDVLEKGRDSSFSHYFDIDWSSAKSVLKDKVLVPILHDYYGKVLESQDLKIIYTDGRFHLDYKDRRLPLNTNTYLHLLKRAEEKLLKGTTKGNSELSEYIDDFEESFSENERIQRLNDLTSSSPAINGAIQDFLDEINGKKEDPQSFDQLDSLLYNQFYRICFWHSANEELNYRRFFEINELVGMQAEKQDVYDAIHKLVFKLIKKGWISGLRIDHVDGLFEPMEYYHRLQESCRNAAESDETTSKPFFVIVEKILVQQEKLRSTWPVHGTTGYDFLNQVNGLFVPEDSAQAMKQIYTDFVGFAGDMDKTIYHAKKSILIFSMSSELHSLTNRLVKIAEQDRHSRDYTFSQLRMALTEIIACFPVYRSYIRLQTEEVAEEDQKEIDAAVKEAGRLNPSADFSLFLFIKSILLLKNPRHLTEEQKELRRQFVLHFQQLSGPVTAKGVEDTAFYRYYPLASLNEVGMDTSKFGLSTNDFHQKNHERYKNWPHSLSATFTHDTKRSEDVRARINVLSERPDEWKEVLQKWHFLNQSIKEMNEEVPDKNEEYLLYQTLIGSWPLEGLNAQNHENYVKRISGYMGKALKEAKIHTNWFSPDTEYEQGIEKFIQTLLQIKEKNEFLEVFNVYIKPIIKAGLLNSLSQLVIKVMSPGIPDFYQGSELWEFTLVDPDNRHPVDYSVRQKFLSSLETSNEDRSFLAQNLFNHPESGLIKLYITKELLNLRRKHPSLFCQGDYRGIECIGKKSQHIVAFSRSYIDEALICITSRFFRHFTSPLGDAWEDASILLPKEMEGEYFDVLTGQVQQIESKTPLSKVLNVLHAAVLIRIHR